MTMLRITVENASPVGGTALTPFWFGLHDGNFDLGDGNSAASAGLEALAEDGTFAAIGAELTEADADGVGGIITGEAGPIDTAEIASTIVTTDGAATQYISLAAMILPSNDAFVGTLDAIEVFDADGNFTGPQTITFEGSDVYDAGTEVNTELDAAFINQMGPNTGETENGVIRFHDGFNGSVGNPEGEGDQIILGGTNAFGNEIDPTIADFTIEGAQIASITIEEVVELRITVNNTSGTNGTALTPFWFGLHDGTFDIGDGGSAASAGLEALAEDGTFEAIGAELIEADADGVGGAVFGSRGPIGFGETAIQTVVASTATQYISLAAMILPSNDAFVGTLDPVQLFDENGDFLGNQTLTFEGSDVYDAGTEVNTELDAAFINQMGPNTGETENGVIRFHDGFNGSVGNPEGEGDQIILGGTNAFGDTIDPTAADFTIDGAQIAEVSIELVNVSLGSDSDETFIQNFGSATRIDGGEGSDTIEFTDTNFADVSIDRIDEGFRVTPTSGSALDFSDVETLSFADQTVTVQSGESVDTVALLYQTLLGRENDAEGLGFWVEQANGDFGLANVGDAFVESDEFASAAGDVSANTDFVSFLYDATLEREADAAGLEFWTSVLDSGALDRGDLAVSFAEAEETQGLFADQIDDGFLLA